MGSARTLHLLGVSFRAAPVAVREQLSFDRASAVAFLREVAAEEPTLEALLLSTCNRTEFVLAAPEGVDPTAPWLARLRRARPAARVLREDCRRYELHGTDAVRHVFRVASGVDSAIVGDVQILGQVKEAMAIATEAGTMGRFLARTLEHAIRCAKRARRDTAIGHGAASAGAVLATMLAGVPAGGTVIVGAGELASDLARHLRKRHAGAFVVVNRSLARARDLARDCGGAARPWEELEDAMAGAEAVVVATSAPSFVVTCAMLERIAARRAGRPLLVVDAAVPSNVEWSSAATVLDVDAVRDRREGALARRRTAVPAVEAIVEHELDAWRRWRVGEPVEAVITSLYRGLGAASAEAARDLAAVATVGAHELTGIIERSFKRMLHEHVRRLRDLSGARVPYVDPAEPAVKGGIVCAH